MMNYTIISLAELNGITLENTKKRSSPGYCRRDGTIGNTDSSERTQSYPRGHFRGNAKSSKGEGKEK